MANGAAPTLEIANVLFLDIVGFSELAMDEQKIWLATLQSEVARNPEVAEGLRSNQLLRLPRGDAMALVFFGDPERAARCALQLSAALKKSQIVVRMGLHSGAVFRVADLDGDMAEVVGDGINIAQRVMDCGDAGHILADEAIVNVLKQLKPWRDALSELGYVEVKHGERLHLFNICRDGVGNPSRPVRLHARKSLLEDDTAQKPDSNRMVRYSTDARDLVVSAGYRAEASAAAIAFLWLNWEVLYAMVSDKIRARRLGLEAWEGSGFCGRGEWHVLHKSIGINHCAIHYFTFGSVLKIPFRAETVMQYDRIDGSTIAYSGQGSTRLPVGMLPMKRIVEALATRATVYINQIGGHTATLITHNPTLVLDKAGEDAFRLYQEYIDEEAALRRDPSGHGRSFKHFTVADQDPDPTSEIELFRAKLAILQKHLEQKPVRETGLNVREYLSALDVYASEPRMAIQKNKLIVEQICRYILDHDSGERIESTATLTRFLNRLDKSAVPENILVLMRAVNSLGGIASHTAHAVGLAATLDDGAFFVSFTATLKITEWFVREYLNRKKSPE